MQDVQHELYYDDYIERNSREFKLDCTIGGKKIPESDIASINIEYDLMSGAEEYTIGNLAAAKLTIVVSKNVEVFETNPIYLTVSLKARDEKGSEVWIPTNLGRFYVFDVSSTNLSKTITAYDDLYKKELEKTYESKLTYPTTVYEILNEICPLLDIDYSSSIPDETIERPEIVTETVFNNGKYEVVVSESDQVCLGMKVGQVLTCIASYVNGNFIVNGNRVLKLIKYPQEINKSLTPNKYAPPVIGLASYSMGKIDCMITQNNMISVGYDEDSSSMKLENPFMDRARLLAILDDLDKINYHQASVRIKGDPRLELGDLIEIINTNSDGGIISKQRIPILRMTFHYSGGCTNNIESPCKPIAEKTINYKGTLTSRLDNLEGTVSSMQSATQGLYDSINVLKSVKDYVDDMNKFVEKQGPKNLTSEISESESKQYDAIFEKIKTSNNTFNSEYDEIYNNKYLQ